VVLIVCSLELQNLLSTLLQHDRFSLKSEHYRQ